MTTKREYTRWTKELLKPIVESSSTYAECLRKMGKKEAGGNYQQLQRNIDRFGLDTSHMVHQAWNKGNEIKPFDELIDPQSIKKRLIKIKGHKCECCGLTRWLNAPIKLELHHIDGDNRNNVKENLQLLCPNCHAYTDNYRGKNINAK